MKSNWKRYAFICVNFAIVLMVALFGIRSAFIDENGVLDIRWGDLIGFMLGIAWIGIGGFLIVRFYRRKS